MARFRVVIAGAGVAALDALVGLSQLAPDRTELTLVAPVETFAYRPASTARPFSLHGERTLRLATVAEDVGARLVFDSVAFVDQDRARVMTRKGDLLPFDALLVAVGARWSPGLRQGLAWWRDESATRAWAALLRDLESGAVDNVAFVVPQRAGWPIDAYELALIAVAAANAAGRSPSIKLLTAEPRPLDALGPAASEAVAEALGAAGVELVTEVRVHEHRRAPPPEHEAGADFLSAMVARPLRRSAATSPPRSTKSRKPSVDLDPGGREVYDRIVSVPMASGPGIGGMARVGHGLLPVDTEARVRGSERVWAAGDATALTVKHGLLAVGQAGAAIGGIAAAAGGDVEPRPWEPRLRGILAHPDEALAESAWVQPGEPLTHCLWWPPGRVAGPSLAPYVARRDPAVHPGVPWHPHGLPVDAPVREVDATGEAEATPGPDELALFQDVSGREIMALRRTERAAWAQERQLEHELGEFVRREQAVIKDLERAGYLHHEGPTRKGATSA